MNAFEPLVDSFGRVHTNLRISVTDRCNIRCFYCMSDDHVDFKPREEILSYEEIERFAGVVARMGVNKVRLTGGEPLVRSDLARLVARLTAIDGIDDVALTTNGILLAEQAAVLKEAGLRRVNISLDALSEATFRRIARRDGLDRVLSGIEAARQVGFEKIRLNAVAIRGITEDEVLPLARFARERSLELRFIEYMPLDADGAWQGDHVLTGEAIRGLLAAEFGPLEATVRDDPAQPAADFAYADGQGRVGFIDPVSQPFCGDCNRLRITADGKVRNCLFSLTEWDARGLLRRSENGGKIDADIATLVRDCVAAKKPGHGIDDEGFIRPERAMYQIGG